MSLESVGKWRFTCPYGHTNWELHENVAYCEGWLESELEVKPSYNELIDQVDLPPREPGEIRNILEGLE